MQNPRMALLDKDLAIGSVKVSGLGVPQAMCGGFALTYTVTSGTKKHAVRCFHRKSRDLEARYAAISAKLAGQKSEYFVPFEYQPRGIRIDKELFPIVVMQWARGDTLGEFLEANYSNPNALMALIDSFSKLATALESMSIAHGDIQPGNVMIDRQGAALQLIDYDGMFVPAIEKLGSAELGHRNFQHPKRTSQDFNARLDRFSFIALNIALRSLIADKKMWAFANSEAEAIVFRAEDFVDPQSSMVFKRLRSVQTLARDTKNLSAICDSPVDSTPSLQDFLAGRNCPPYVEKPKRPAARGISDVEKSAVPAYAGQYPVLNADNYSVFDLHIGGVVELIGRVFEVTSNATRRGKPYIFVNFGPWRGKAVKLNIWPEILSKLAARPTKSWAGTWVSVIGMVDAPFSSARYGYTHISITINSPHQIKRISPEEARRRLGGRTMSASTLTNAERLNRLGLGSQNRGSLAVTKPATPNQSVLNQMRGSKQIGSPSTQQSQTSPTKPKGGLSHIPWWIWLIAAFIVFAMFFSR